MINGSLEQVQSQIVDFEKFVEWSPWSELDPDMKKEFSGTQGEVGAVYNWTGSEEKINEIGEGSQTVTYISKDSVGIDLANLLE